MTNHRTRILLMRSLVATIAISAILGGPAPAADRPEREAFDDAVDRGLEYLARNQNGDGSWSTARQGGRDPAVTSLAVMAFMSSGHVPGEGRYGGAVDKAIKFVLDQQQRNGLIAGQF